MASSDDQAAVTAEAVLERIEQRMRTLGLSESDLARGIGVARSTVNSWWPRTGREAVWPGSRLLAPLARELGTTVDWLLTGKGPMVRSGETGGAAFTSGVTAVLQKIVELEDRVRQEFLGEELERQMAAPTPTSRARALTDAAELRSAAKAKRQMEQGASPRKTARRK